MLDHFVHFDWHSQELVPLQLSAKSVQKLYAITCQLISSSSVYTYTISVDLFKWRAFIFFCLFVWVDHTQRCSEITQKLLPALLRGTVLDAKGQILVICVEGKQPTCLLAL